MSPRTRRRRKSPGGKSFKARRSKFRSLAELLDAQPRGLVNISGHRFLWDRFMSSDSLQKLRISPKCYRLLNNATPSPENLQNFYRTYRLPEDSFFPLFLKVKKEWFTQRALWKEARETAILEIMKELPNHRRHALRVLAEYEAGHHPSGTYPIWENHLFPKTKKKAEAFLLYGEQEWHETWKKHLRELSARYRGIPLPGKDDEERSNSSARLLAKLLLRCDKTDRREIAENYRKLSKEYHPDKGGSSEAFLLVKEARDTLLEN